MPTPTTSKPPRKKPRVSARGCKEKGSAYERELAAFFNEHIFPGHDPARPPVSRAPLSGSFSVYANTGLCDLIGTPMLWVEAKRTETVRPYEFMKQAVSGVYAHQSTDIPVVITRRNQQSIGDSLCFVRLSDFVELYRLALTQVGCIKPVLSPGTPTRQPSPIITEILEKSTSPQMPSPGTTSLPNQDTI